MTVLDTTVGAMRVRVHRDPGALATAAADQVAGVLRDATATRGVAHAMFATGNSQMAMLDMLVRDSTVDWSRVVAFHMDEYVGIPDSHPASFRRYLRERISERVPVGAFHFIDGDAGDLDAECARYAALLREYPLDLCCLGIGENGHLAFNDPPVADFHDPFDVKVVELDDACREQQVGEGHFPDVAAVPTHAVTVTIPALLRATTVVAVVPEGRKAEPVRRALTGPVDTACPASILREHAQVTLHLDADSASAWMRRT